MLDWLPLPHDFAARLREASRGGSPLERAQRLGALANSRLDFLQTIQVDRAMQALSQEPGRAPSSHRLAILGSTTLEHLAPAIRVAGLRRNLWVDVHCGGYGQYRQEILDPASAARAFAPQTILLSIAATHVLPEIEPGTAADELDQRLAEVIEELRSLWRRVRADFDANLIQQTFLDLTEPLFGNFDRLVPASPWRVVQRLNQLLADAALAESVALLDVSRASERDGRDAWFDTARMLQAKQEIAPQAAPAYGELVARVLDAQRGTAKKCLVVDLDNTLWGGVLGDDGIQGLVLGQGSAAGEAYLAVQRYARQLKDRGIILAVCSKNDPLLAQEAFAAHPEMILKRSDFAAFLANWEDKARNLEVIADQLNIGLDALVFLDDNPAERARVREALPAVAVPELPEDVANYVACLAAAGYFESIGFTAEDRQRAASYTQNTQREALRGSSQSMAEFLQGLQMRVIFEPFAAIDLPRLTQLINKTNQFNPTTRRYSADQVAKFLDAPGTLSLQFRLHDRFGDNGLVSAMILRPVAGAADRLEIDTWVMSCRVFGRQLEHEAMNIAVESAQRAGIRTILATYSATAKNGVIRDLFAMLGFTADESTKSAEGTTHWLLRLESYTPTSTYIAREARQT